METNSPDPIKSLIRELLEERYEGVTFADEIIENIEAKIAPIIKKHTEEAVIEFVSDFFSAKKPVRKPRKTTTPKKAASTKTDEESSKPAASPDSMPTAETEKPASPTPPVSTPASEQTTSSDTPTPAMAPAAPLPTAPTPPSF